MKTKNKSKENKRTERYNQYFNQSKENLDLIMQSIRIKNEMFARGLTYESNFLK